ncbi:MAG: PEP-CTERM sorting domain-containing protein [Verrucomicrobiota bacterium JB022]|nr:PEP-CTERM sorting domain-containing protein [Verrucomicrobiota bacterium JB022]
MNLILRAFLSTPLAVLAPLSTANAAISLTGDVLTTGGVFTITQDITLEINTSGTQNLILSFDQWVNSDGGYGSLDIYQADPIYVQINNGPLQALSNPYIVDDLPFSLLDMSLNSGYLALDAYDLVAGDTFMVLAGSWETYAATEDFNPEAVQTFTGEVFLVDINTAQRVSSIVSVDAPPAVPEPGAYAALAGLATLGFAFWNRRKA